MSAFILPHTESLVQTSLSSHHGSSLSLSQLFILSARARPEGFVTQHLYRAQRAEREKAGSVVLLSGSDGEERRELCSSLHSPEKRTPGQSPGSQLCPLHVRHQGDISLCLVSGEDHHSQEHFTICLPVSLPYDLCVKTVETVLEKSHPKRTELPSFRPPVTRRPILSLKDCAR